MRLNKKERDWLIELIDKHGRYEEIGYPIRDKLMSKG